MKKVRIGIIGCGVIAAKHAMAIRALSNGELTACYSDIQAETDSFAKAHHIEAFGSYEALLSSPNVDAVSLCTPSGLHTPQALTALDYGKHVILEKPMSLTLEEADRLIERAEQSALKVAVISQCRFAPAVLEIKRAIDACALGRLISGSLQMRFFRSEAYYASSPWRGTWAMDGGGALMNQGIHGVDILRFLMGPAKSLTGYARTLKHPIEVEDTAAAIVEFESGALGAIECSTACSPGYPRRFEICGERGSVILEEDVILRWDMDAPCRLPVGGHADNVASSDPGAITSDGHTRQFQNFCNAILNGEPLWADARAGRLPLEIILGIYRSSQTGRTVYLADMP